MSAPSIVNALVAWATGDDARIAELVAVRDACVPSILTGKPLVTLTAGSLNGKSFTGLARLNTDEKLALFHVIGLGLSQRYRTQINFKYRKHDARE